MKNMIITIALVLILTLLNRFQVYVGAEMVKDYNSETINIMEEK